MSWLSVGLEVILIWAAGDGMGVVLCAEFGGGLLMIGWEPAEAEQNIGVVVLF
jgi:hypothetical protein